MPWRHENLTQNYRLRRFKDSRFAEKVDAKHFWQWEDAGLGKWDGAFQPFFEQASSKANHIHFNLSGMDVDKALRQKIDFNLSSNVTNSELNTILQTPNLLEKTTFYRDGSKVSAPNRIDD